MSTSPFAPYRAAPGHYWITLQYRFHASTIRRHQAALMRGIVNRDLRVAA